MSFNPTVNLDTRLESGGTFSILISDIGSDDTGAYSLTIRSLNNLLGIIPLSFGQTVTGSIDSIGEMDAYSFQAQAGDMVRVRATTQGGITQGGITPHIELFDAQGKRLDRAFSFNPPVNLDTRLESGGTFSILVSDFGSDDTGAYSLTLELR